MATITISVDVSSDGTYLVLKDLTPIAEYTGEGVDITTDITSVAFTLYDDETVPNEYSLDVTSVFLTDIRDVNGYVITTDSLSYGSTFFTDGIYTSKLEISEDSSGPIIVHTGTSEDMFISQILQIVTSQVIDADWKDLYNPYNNRLSSDLRKRLLVIAIIYSVQAGLLSNAESQRLALNKLCSYAG